jgi:alpha-amylase
VSKPDPGTGADLHFLFGIHNHQPVGNLDHVVAEACRRAYHPFLLCLKESPHVTLTLHASGGLLEWLKERAPATFDLLGELVQRGQIEMLTGGFYEPILPVLPDWDKVGQIQRLTEFLVRHFGARPRGMWLAERVWEPHLPKPLREAGVEYVLVDDGHFLLAGLDPDRLGGYYLTEEQGETLAVFPINQRLRYQVPFAEPARTLELLAHHRGQQLAITLADDGEKFGVWPGTYRLVYEEGWLTRFFETLGTAQWLRLTTFSRYLDRFPPTGRIYLPTAAYREMGEWALPAEAGEALASVRAELSSLPGGEALAGWLRGGFWRNFLVKYPEANDCHWKMLRLSRAIHAALARRPMDPQLAAARTQLWRGQGNDAYWHGVFGGVYLAHLRRATKQALIAADRLLREATGAAAVQWNQEDVNGDGRVEVTIRTPTLSLVLHPEAGGSLTELAYLPKGVDLADVLTRRPEAYHAQVKSALATPDTGRVRTIHERVLAKEPGLSSLLGYDRFRRASLLDGLFPESGTLDALHPWDAGWVTLGDFRMDTDVHGSTETVSVRFSAESLNGRPLTVQKVVSVLSKQAQLAVIYRLRWSGAEALVARWGTQWNLALTGGAGPGRYLGLPDRPPLASRGEVGDRLTLSLVDEWLGTEVALQWGHRAHVAWAPVETVSLSEAGFERLYQGSAILLAWPLELPPGGEWEEEITLSVVDLSGNAE